MPKASRYPPSARWGCWDDTDYSCKAAGGVLIQLLPFADEAVIEKIERNLPAYTELSRLIASGLTNREIANIAFSDIPFDVFDQLDISYICDCSRERMGAQSDRAGQKNADGYHPPAAQDRGLLPFLQSKVRLRCGRSGPVAKGGRL